MTDWLNEIEAQADDTSPYYLPRLIAEIRRLRALLAAVSTGAQEPPTFQQRVDPWLLACFGEDIARDYIERNHRFIEEALELVQANGCTRDEAHSIVDYVFNRPVGAVNQEIGGTMVTLAALCLAIGEDMHAAGETELQRIWGAVEKIRAKQAAKPKHSPLPVATPPPRSEPPQGDPR